MLEENQTLYETMGGEWALRAVIDTFVDRMLGDPMIGFFFRGVSPDHLKEREFELAASLLGGPFRYTGRPLREAHRAHRIMGGQFARRTQLLREVLREQHVPEPVQHAWMDHVARLRDQITTDAEGHCSTASEAEEPGPRPAAK